MKREDVEFHSDGHGRGGNPAINVKCYSFGGKLTAKELGCSDATFERAMGFAWDAACQAFWERAQERAKELFPNGKLYSEGCSAGWAVIHGLPDVETWDAVALGKWASFARWCREEIAYMTSRETVKSNIEANRWAEEGAEAYNFCDDGGKTVCMVDLKRDAVAAGFAAVVRA